MLLMCGNDSIADCFVTLAKPCQYTTLHQPCSHVNRLRVNNVSCSSYLFGDNIHVHDLQPIASELLAVCLKPSAMVSEIQSSLMLPLLQHQQLKRRSIVMSAAIGKLLVPAFPLQMSFDV